MKNYLKKRKKNKTKKRSIDVDVWKCFPIIIVPHYIAPRPCIIFLVVDYSFGDCKCQRVKDTNSFLFRSLSILQDQKKRKPFWLGFHFIVHGKWSVAFFTELCVCVTVCGCVEETSLDQWNDSTDPTNCPHQLTHVTLSDDDTFFLVGLSFSLS
jgi:hypothetical protein